MAAHSGQSNHLSSLSDSAIWCIFQFLEDSELYDFSMTCVRMHKPALSMLLSRRSIPDPLESVDIHVGDMSNTLQVLRIALFLPSIRQLSLRFSPGITPSLVEPFLPLTVDQLRTTADVLLGEMLRLRRLLAKLTSVDEITLILPGSLEWNLRDINLERGDTSDIFPWLPVISFLEEIAGNHCTKFKVLNSSFRTQARTVTRPAKATGGSLPHIFRRIVKRDREMDMTALARWNIMQYRPHKYPHADTIRTGSSLTHFHIQTTLLLFPGAAGWTFSTLKHSPVVSLHISGLSVSRWDWGPIASKLVDAVPDLLELNFDDTQIEPERFVWMLNRLSRLTTLKIGPRMSVYLTYPRLFPAFSRWYLPAFRNLVKLSTPTCYLSLFVIRRNPFPALTLLEIPPIDIYRISTQHYKTMHMRLPQIAHRLHNINHVLSPLPVTISLGWMGSDIVSPLSRHIDTSLALDPKHLDALREITHLVLDEFDSLIDPRLLCRWLRLFPSLRQVSWNDSIAKRATLANIPRLAREISRACPTIEIIIAQGVRYSISTGTASTEGVRTAIQRFVDLPTEVLLIIFDFLQDDLIYLSILCRRLHFLALPIFLDRNSIRNPSKTTLVDIGRTDAATVLQALTLALFVPSIQHLICAFPSAYIHRYLDSIRRVTRLVRRLTKVEKLSLKFVPNKIGPGNYLHDVYSASRLWKLCYCALRDLLNAASDKSCASLTILGFPAPVACTGTPPPPPSPPTSIRSVTDLSLDMDLSAPYSSWMFLALKDSPITSLKLVITADTKLEDVIDFPDTLTTLSIDGVGYAPRGWITNYLGKHPRMQTLTLTYGVFRTDPTADFMGAMPLRLDNLVDLTAPVSYLSHFLRTCTPTPALECLRILLDDLEALDWNVISLIERVRESYLSPPTIIVEVTNSLDVGSLADSMAFMSFMGRKWIHAARHIVGLAVECDPRWFNSMETGSVDPAAVQTLLTWFRLFNGLCNIYVQAPTVDAFSGVAEHISCAFPNVQVIRTNGKTWFER
ncbi:hypothetical protein B0H19DRAFT_1369262 [Mycena capillaripes]|nr:hypothetical protein B0H19DRAFT_1369262 [Mycena capillaripes]